MATMRDLQLKALDIAFGEVGTTETAPNRGPRIERYLQAVGLPPGLPWCCAFVVFCYHEAARVLGMESPLPRTGKVTRFYRKAKAVWRATEPTPGAIYCHATDPGDWDSPGHCGICIRPDDGKGRIVGVEGNSNDGGSREGDSVVVHYRKPAYVNLGYVDITRVAPPPPMRPI